MAREQEFENWVSFLTNDLYRLRKACKTMTECPQELFFRDACGRFAEEAQRLIIDLEAANGHLDDEAAKACFREALRECKAYEAKERGKEAQA